MCFSSHFSPDGLLKIWDETKSQVSEVQLDESLTSACFLNAFGDVVVAFKNHIFFIDRAQGKIDEVKLYYFFTYKQQLCRSSYEMITSILKALEFYEKLCLSFPDVAEKC